jgi:two-component system KDP operon response regulator KdpE
MNSVEILIIDDETQIQKLLEITLESNDFKVTQAVTAKEGLLFAANHPPDLILLDLGLPDDCGQNVLVKLREWYNKPILILSVQSDEENIVRALDNGANDYLVKPFEFKELSARVRALSKRSSSTVSSDASPVLSIADLTLNNDSKIAKRGEKTIDLTAKEFLLLEYFMRNKGRVISRSEIAEKVWGINFDTGTNVVDVYIQRLRRKIDDGHELKLLQTVRGVGYSLRGES